MQRLTLLIVGLALTAASCNLTAPFGGQVLGGVFRSEDAAQSFSPTNNLEAKGDISNLSVNALAFNPHDAKQLYLGSSSGVHKSENEASFWKLILTGMAVADLAVDPLNSVVLYVSGVSGGNGKIIKSMDGGVSWLDLYTEPTKSNPVRSIAVSPFNSSVLVAGLDSGEIIRSTDAGASWQSVTDLNDRIVKIRFDRNNQVYALLAGAGLFYSPDQGVAWQSISDKLTGQSFFNQDNALPAISAFRDFALDPRQRGVIYVGTDEGLLRTVNNGESWALLTLPVKDEALSVSSVAVNPSNSNNVYVSIGATLLQSVNGGITWETKRILNARTIRLILVDFQSPNVVYLGLGEVKR